jgi:hypothetical protein
MTFVFSFASWMVGWVVFFLLPFFFSIVVFRVWSASFFCLEHFSVETSTRSLYFTRVIEGSVH